MPTTMKFCGKLRIMQKNAEEGAADERNAEAAWSEWMQLGCGSIRVAGKSRLVRKNSQHMAGGVQSRFKTITITWM